MDKLISRPPFSAREQVEIRAELARVLVSKRFVNANRMSKLLSYVVEETLAGRRDRIKAFSIAQDVYGRDSSFNPQRDPIVRVDASRLRKCLAEYYEDTEQNAGVQIEVPKGGYGPVFTSVGPSARRTFRWAWPLGTLITLVILGLLLGGRIGGEKSQSVRQDASESTQVLLAVLPLAYDSTDQRATRLANSFVDSTITLLARYSGLSVVAHSSMLEFEDGLVNTSVLQSVYGITHALRGNIERRGEELRIGVQLVDTGTSQTIWAQQLEGTIAQLWELQDRLTQDVLNALAQQNSPDLQSVLPARYTQNIEALTLYRQGLFMIIPPNEVKRVDAARQLFARVRELDSEFAGGYVGASWSYTLPVLFQTTSEREQYLQQAVAYAEQAIEVDPSFGAGFVALGFSQSLLGNALSALESTRMGIAVQPGDAFVQFLAGVVFVLSGHPQEAFHFLEEALRLNPIEKRSPYLNVYGIAHIVDRQYEQALAIFARNDARGGPQGPHMAVFRAAAHAHLGEHQKAREIVQQLNTSVPDYPYAGWLRDWLGRGEHFQSTLEKLSDLGLEQLQGVVAER